MKNRYPKDYENRSEIIKKKWDKILSKHLQEGPTTTKEKKVARNRKMYLMTRDKKFLPKIYKPLRKQPKKATQGYQGPIRTLADVEREEEFIR